MEDMIIQAFFEPNFTIAADILRYSKNIVILTGAGISTGSGIKDFRSPNGLWQEYDPTVYVDYETFKEDPSLYWEVERKVMPSFKKAKPNKAHKALKKMEKKIKKNGMGEVKAIITQNIDNLHQDVGSNAPILELHGNAYDVNCLDCGAQIKRKKVNKMLKKSKNVPTCPECGGKIKTDVTLFREPIDTKTLEKARDLAKECDTMLILGTSLEVFPANELPVLAKMNNAKLICMNNEATVKDRYFKVKIIGDLTKTLPALVKML